MGDTVTIFTPVPEPGRYCYAVWAIDRANARAHRPSLRPSMFADYGLTRTPEEGGRSLGSGPVSG